MKEKITGVLMLALILTGTLSMAFIIRPSFAESGENSVLGMDFMEKTGETAFPNEANKLDQAEGFDSNWYDIFERKPDAEQDINLERLNQASRNAGDGWNFNDTSEWSSFAYVDGSKTRLIVGVNREKPTSLLELEKIAAKHQAEIVNTILIGGEVRAVVVELLLASVAAFVEEIRVAGLASYVEPNMKVQAQLVPDDPYWSLQWGPQKIEADWAWNTTVGSYDVLVAVVDTGIDYAHPDLEANYVPLGYDWVNMDEDPLDDFGHGTHCAGIIAAVLNNSVGIAGLAQVRVMAEKVLDSWGWGYWDWVASGIIHATDYGADIISMSLGGYYDSELVHEAVRYAYDEGVLVVAAAGNEATNMKLYPAGYDEVIAVAATDQYDDTAWWSNYGDWIELAAPGVDIYSTMPTYYVTLNDWGYAMNYDYLSGTSMACPHVAGVAALVWSMFPNKTRDWVRLWLRYTADDLGDEGFDIYYGYGRINAREAVEQTPPEHELIAYEWRTPPYVEPEALGMINATILNFGENNETDVTVQLFANGTLVGSASIDFLAGGNSTTVSLLWYPTVEGLYNVTLYVVPVPGETSLENNVLWKYIYVGFPVKAFVLHSAGNILGDIITSWQVLNSEWHLFGDVMIYIDYTTLNKEDITYEDIAVTEADVLIISCAFDPYSGWEFTDSEIEAIERYVHEGHGLIATAGTLYYWVPNNNKLAPLFGLNETTLWDVTGTDLLHLLNTTHPLFRNVPNPFVFADVGTAIPFDWRWDSNELVGGKYLALGHYQESAIVTYRGLVYISPWLEVIPPYYHHHLQLLYNAITWSCYQKPEHELIASLEAPKALKPSQSVLLNATVSNMGLNNETNIMLQLLINSEVVNSANITELLIGDSYTLNYTWAPTIEGFYNVTAYAIPVPGEDNILNNVKSTRVIVSHLVVALCKNVDPWNYPSNEEALNLYGIPYVVFRSSDFGNVDLNAFTKVVIVSDQDQAFYNAMDTYRWWFEDYVSNGGILEIHAADRGWHGGGWIGPLPGGLEWASRYANYVTIIDYAHPVVTTPNLISDAELDDWYRSVHGYFRTYQADSHVVIIEGYTQQPAYLEFNYGAGDIAASSQTLEWAYKRQYSRILENSLLYMPMRYEHDLAVTLDIPAVLEPGDSALLNATLHNRGLNNETYVGLQLLINDTVVDSVLIPELLTGASYTLSHLWTPTVEGIYNVTAYAPPIPEEAITENNIASKSIKVQVLPDILIVADDDALYWIQGTSLQEFESALTAAGYDYFVWKESTMGRPSLEFLAKFELVIWTCGDYWSWAVDPTDAEMLEAYLAQGGNILLEGEDIGYDHYADRFMVSVAHAIFQVDWTGAPGLTVTDPTHPVTQGLPTSFTWLTYPPWDDGVTPTNEGFEVIRYTGTSWTAVTVFDGTGTSYGSVVYYAFPAYCLAQPQRDTLIINSVSWLSPPQHDLHVTIEASAYLKPGDSILLNATVHNIGLSNETDVELQLLIDGSVVESAIISFLQTGSSYTLSHLWTPTIEGVYNVTAYAPPVPEEFRTINNRATKLTTVTYPLINPIEGQWANYTICYINPDTEIIIGNGELNLTYTRYVSPYQINTTLWLRAPENYTQTGWMIVNIMNRYVESGIWAGMWYPGWIETNITIASPVIILDSIAMVVGDRIILVGGIPIDCWELRLESYGYYYLFWYDKVSGLWIGMEVEAADYKVSLLLVATNIPIGFQYEHDLAVSLMAPASLKPGESTILQAIVSNGGLSNETDVELQLLINDELVKSIVISELVSGSSYMLSYLWTPSIEGIYNVTAYAPPVADEAYTANNVATAMVTVVTMVLPTDRPVVYVYPESTEAYVGDTFTISVVVFNLTDNIVPNPDWQPGEPFNVSLGNLYGLDIQFSWDPTILEYIGHAVTIPVEDYPGGILHKPVLQVKDEVNSTAGTYWLAYASMYPAEPFNCPNETAIVFTMTFQALTSGMCTLDLFEVTLADKNGDSILHFALDGYVEIVEYLPTLHDVAILNVTRYPSAVYVGRIVNITVVAKNYGEENETFGITVYYDNILIEKQTITLAPSEERTLTFLWNTTGLQPCHTYTIWAEATVVPGETNIDDNVFIDGEVHIKMLGDINGDGKVDILDVVLAAVAYGSKPGDENWNPDADLASPYGLIDICDLVTVTAFYGTCLP